MKMLSQYLSHITSSLYSCILSWKAKLPFPMKNTPERHHTGKCQSGLKTLVHSDVKLPPRVLHRFETLKVSESKSSLSPPRPSSLSWLWSQSSPPFRTTTMMGDVIGTESGDCMITDFEETVLAKPEPRKASYKERSKKKREFPPPITVLRETGQMPWTFKKECSDDGRLIITVERVRCNENCIISGDYYCEECGYPIDDEDGDFDFEFNEGFECVEEEEDEEECGFDFDFDFDFEQEFVKKGSNESEQLGGLDLRQCVTYDNAGLGLGPRGLLHHSDSFPNIYLGRPASAPLRPMTRVM